MIPDLHFRRYLPPALRRKRPGTRAALVRALFATVGQRRSVAELVELMRPTPAGRTHNAIGDLVTLGELRRVRYGLVERIR